MMFAVMTLISHMDIIICSRFVRVFYNDGGGGDGICVDGSDDTVVPIGSE